ncbi:UNVERIFIED_ORG: sporulation related protein [Martelella mediterranea]
MADKNKPDHDAGKVEQDDPFAELARLIAPREEEKPRAPETADDLADELLREFDAFPGQYPAAEDQPAAPEPYMEPEPQPEPGPAPQGQPLVFESFHPVDYPVRQPREEPPAPVDDYVETPLPSQPPEPSLDEAFLEEELRQSISSLDLSDDRQDEPLPAAEEDMRAEEPVPGPAFLVEPPEADTQAQEAGWEETWSPTSQTDDPSVSDADVERQENELALDLDELALELSDVAAAEDNGPEPLEEAGAVEAGRDDVFDPAAIVSTDDIPAPIDELDLPRMGDEAEPAHEPPPPYEFDLDEELADALASQAALVDPLAEAPPAEAEPAPDNAGHVHDDRVYDEDIERALEDGFQFTETGAPGEQNAYADLADDGYYDSDARERRPSWLAVTFMGYGRVMLVGLAVVVLAVLSLFAGMRYFGGESDSGPVIIAADDTSVKEAPEDPGGEVVPNQDNVIFNDASDTLEAAPRQGSLIASDQEPVDVDNIAPNPLANDTAGQAGSGVVEPRRVRTIIVRPDGTLVERSAPEEDANSGTTNNVRGLDTVTAMPDNAGRLVPAGSENGSNAADAGMEAGTAPQAAPGAAPETTQNPSVADVLNGTAAETAATQTEDTANAEPAADAEPEAAEAPVEDFGIANVPIPTPRSSTGGAPVSTASAPAQPAPAAPAQPAASAAPAASASAPSSRYAMQIASLPSETEARQAYQRLAAQYPAILGRRPVEFVRADVAGRGTYYRVRIPAENLSAALSLCENFKAAGGSCYVPR